ncbi:MAG: arginyltransferase [Spirochaetaceae bacterium]|nr:arginyltransferase [Spirochaetaceae bacterium]MCF7947081.1 arginyltransferase [Spirochaetia bacterium]MCF7950082.1 arginyltransferase [Spirochaetaceae bacterium]
MNIQGIPMGLLETPCPYIDGLTFESETLVVREIDAEGMNFMLAIGFRHFGEHFFRPLCSECSQCIPIRIPVRKFTFNRSFRRVLRKNRHLRVVQSELEPTAEKYDLYCAHSERFEHNGEPSYEDFKHSFFENAPFGKELQIYEGEKLLAVSHMDMSPSVLSAIYCYWDPNYAHLSLGTYAVLRQIALARQRRSEYLYLGYYVHENAHMNYKAKFKHIEALLTEYNWVPLLDEQQRQVRSEVIEHGFIAQTRLGTDTEAEQ